MKEKEMKKRGRERGREIRKNLFPFGHRVSLEIPMELNSLC